ncbi:hypothetical protein B484DRAFT_122439 [Ochromonadaceae sp. CCMP2298]|nr:hypothetical protein B484DRAFT_122439 [Ochromonadaceae sp. CCMP2298]
MSTPAEDVRRHIKQFGFKALHLEEQQWNLLDQARCPGKYEWLRELEEKERVKRIEKGKKEERPNPALEEFRMTKVEIEYIMSTPFSMLSRKEVTVRKLLTKFHDDADALRKSLAAMAYSFDPHVAERIRSKNPKSYNKEQKHWASIDRILHPEIWQFYVNHHENFLDRHEKEAGDPNKGKSKRPKKKKKNKAPKLADASGDSSVGGSSWFGGMLGGANTKQESSTWSLLGSVGGKTKRQNSMVKRQDSAMGTAKRQDSVGSGWGLRQNSVVKRQDSAMGTVERLDSVGSGWGLNTFFSGSKSSLQSSQDGAKEDQERKKERRDKEMEEEEEEESEDEFDTGGEGGDGGLQEMTEEHNLALKRMQTRVRLSSREGMVRTRRTLVDLDSETWECSIDKEAVLLIWRTPRQFLTTDDERHVFRLLMKYNGQYSSYMDEIMQARRRQGNSVQEGRHIQWEKAGKLVAKDVDFRARQLLREVDRATYTRNDWISSDVLHANDQKFPTKVLRMHLEEALDGLLAEQIGDRERHARMKHESDSEEDPAELAHLALEVVEEEWGEEGGQEELGGVGAVGGVGWLGVEEGRKGKEKGEEKGKTRDGVDAEMLAKVNCRTRRREKRKLKIKKLSEELEVQQAKRKLAHKKSGHALAEAIMQEQLGQSGCLACRTKYCRWQPPEDKKLCFERKDVLDQELERVRKDREATIFESEVVLSVLLGGNKVFKRQDLIDELSSEQRELSNRIELVDIDRELHDAHATRKDTYESSHLHGFALIMWTQNARTALFGRQSHLCSLSVAREVVDDILDWMLDGWFFGERQNEDKGDLEGAVSPYHNSNPGSPHRSPVPKSSPEKEKKKKIASADVFMALEKARENKQKREDVGKPKRLDVGIKQAGLLLERGFEESQVTGKQAEGLKVARGGNAHERKLDATEVNIKFGIFMLTMMYFRAMVYLRKERERGRVGAKGVGEKGAQGKGGGDEGGAFDKMMTDDRIREIDEAKRAEARRKKIDIMLARTHEGEARRLLREKTEQREAIDRLQSIVRRQRLENECISVIQKQYRGHLGRKAGFRWRLKRDELHAATALLTSAAVGVQRIFRGYSDRLYAINKRREMRQFIALMRVQESQMDEEMYWQTHPWSKFKKTQKEWVAMKLEEMKVREEGAGHLSPEEQMELDKLKRDYAGLEEGEEEEESLGEEESLAEVEDEIEAVLRSKKEGKEKAKKEESPKKDAPPPYAPPP